MSVRFKMGKNITLTHTNTHTHIDRRTDGQTFYYGVVTVASVPFQDPLSLDSCVVCRDSGETNTPY